MAGKAVLPTPRFPPSALATTRIRPKANARSLPPSRRAPPPEIPSSLRINSTRTSFNSGSAITTELALRRDVKGERPGAADAAISDAYVAPATDRMARTPLVGAVADVRWPGQTRSDSDKRDVPCERSRCGRRGTAAVDCSGVTRRRSLPVVGRRSAGRLAPFVYLDVHKRWHQLVAHGVGQSWRMMQQPPARGDESSYRVKGIGQRHRSLISSIAPSPWKVEHIRTTS
eukprot:364635-Chlamydomonas_euryale.AAC.9